MNNKAFQYNPKAKHQITTCFKFACIFDSEHILTVIIHSWLSVFPSIPTCWCILISHLSTAPVSAAPVLSAKGQAGPPSRVHTFSREINGLSLQFLPLSFFVIVSWGMSSKGKHTLGHVCRLETDGRSSCVDEFGNLRTLHVDSDWGR